MAACETGAATMRKGRRFVIAPSKWRTVVSPSLHRDEATAPGREVRGPACAGSWAPGRLQVAASRL